MKGNPWFYFSMIILTFFGGCTFLVFGSIAGLVQGGNRIEITKKDSILLLELEGVILDGKKFVKELREYAPQEHVKGILVRVNSPGGVVGPSQEIYQEILRVREELKKPIYVSANGLMASGAFYAAMGATKIYANKGSLLGSIGVIMNFADLKELYEWAKIKRFNLSTGKFKDTGSDFRSMREDEKAYLESLLAESLEQFISDIAEGRGIDVEKIRPWADGRVFTGVFAKQQNFIDEVGGFSAAVQDLGELAGLGPSPHLFRPQKSPEDFLLLFEEQMEGLLPWGAVERKLQLHGLGQPMYLLPQYLEP